MKTASKLCSCCHRTLSVLMFSPHGRHFDGLRDECNPCLEAKRAALAKSKWTIRKVLPQYIAPGVVRAAAELTKSTGHAHAVDHIVPLVSPLVQSLNGPNRQPKYRFVGPLLPIVQGLNVAANLRAFDAAQNAAKSNRWWPDMPDHPELVAAKKRFDANPPKPIPAGGMCRNNQKAGKRVVHQGDFSIVRRKSVAHNFNQK